MRRHNVHNRVAVTLAWLDKCFGTHYILRVRSLRVLANTMVKSEREKALNELVSCLDSCSPTIGLYQAITASQTSRILESMVGELVMDATLASHQEVARSRAVCHICHTRCVICFRSRDFTSLTSGAPRCGLGKHVAFIVARRTSCPR